MQSLWMVVASVFFAFYGVFVKFAGAEGVGSWEILFYRCFFGLIFMYFMLRISGVPVTTTKPVHHAVRSIFGTAAMTAGIYSISHLNLGLAMTLNYTAPLFIGAFVTANCLWHHARVNWGLMLSIVAGFIGVVTLLGPTIGPKEYGAAMVGLAAGLFTAIATSYVKKLGNMHEPESRIIFYLMLCGSIIGFAGMAVFGQMKLLSAASLPWVFGLCMVSVLGQLCLTRAFSRGNMVLSGALQYSVILFATLLGELLFGEKATVAIVLGMIIIVASGFAASWFTKKEIAAAKKLAAEKAARAS
jgi:S-adenosylmethionine uptake transporter